jgi:membrane protein required for colicin V production
VNWLDIFLSILAAAFIFEGVRRGFSRLLIGLLATLAGLLMACWFYGSAGSFLSPYVSARAVANVAGFLLVFISIQLLGALLGWLLSRVFKWSGLGWLDRLLGAAVGLLKAVLVGIVLIMMLAAFPLKSVPASVAESKVAPYLIEASHVLVYLAPRELKSGFLSTYERIKHVWTAKPAGAPEKESI